MSNPYIIFEEQDDSIKDIVANFIAQGVLKGWIKGKMIPYFGSSVMGYSLTQKSINAGFGDIRALARFYRVTKGQFPPELETDGE